MSSYASFIFLFLFFFLTSFRASAQNPHYMFHFCPNMSRNSTYSTNLTTLLSSLSSPNASYSTGFQNATAGQDPNRVTGLFLCRGDVSTEVCRSCVTLSVKETLIRCPNEREAVLFYEECMLRYSHQNILSTLTYDGGYILMNDNNVSSNQEDQFEDFVSSTLNQAAIEAASSPRKFYTRKANSTAHQNLHFLVQCTPDLGGVDCLKCLQRSINGMPLYRIGGRLFWPSCGSRYELYPFYNETAAGTPLLPPASSPPVSSPPRPRKGGNSNVLVIAIVGPIIVVVLLFIAGYCFLAKRKKKTYDTAPAFDGDDITTTELLQVDHRTIQAATNDYSENNKIGQGGFGEVYKGTFSDGTEVAVKRLSKTSSQGAQEFKNEVAVVAKLHHRNLVRLLGFCLEDEEKILVYEFVPNKSLDYFLFEPTKQGQLDWRKRYNIIGGITRGLLYLHQDSQLKIIHRDLKAGNILLDADMNPKIADFGMARVFGMDQSKENTKRISGTHGYMPPEHVMQGQFSIKSDVYSFGVLVLEIISGKKTSSFCQSNNMAQNLVTHAWGLWRKGSPLDLVDPTIAYSNQSEEVTRCIHIVLLCVQKDPKDRPTLSTIMLMLTSNTLILHVPRPPGFFFPKRRNQEGVSEGFGSRQSMINPNSQTINDVTITDLDPR